MRLKKYTFLLLILLTGQGVFSQFDNAVRTNLTGLPVQLYSLQYERSFGEYIGFNNTFFYRPKVAIPFGGFIDNIAKTHGVGLTGIKFEYIFMDEAQVGLKGYSPEVRFYLKKSDHRPFLGLFGIYEDFDMRVPAEIRVKTLDVKVPVNFTFFTIAGGLNVGYQFRWDRIGLDFVLIGPHIGKADAFDAVGQNKAIQNLTESEKANLKNDINRRFGLSQKYFSLEVTDTSAEIKSIRSVPFVGVRGLGFNFSYRF